MSDENNEKRERRRAIRHQCKVYVGMVIQFCIAGDWSEDSREVKGRLLDLNAGGAKFFTRECFERGQQLRLRILMPGQPEVPAEALVCWSKRIQDKGGFATGVKFHKLSSEGARAIDAFLATLGE
ncbi:MAG: hypothetical protein GWP08_06115 [Nitrospiraceae bacterium]|nr:hypothetical protein [Nitrospiraceae bacterium]